MGTPRKKEGFRNLDDFRQAVMSHCAKTSSFGNSWDQFQPVVERLLGSSPSGEDIFRLGDHLSEIFKANASGGRGQSTLSVGGKAWECLVCWYLNFVLWGTDAVVVLPLVRFVPPVLSNATSVRVLGVKTNKETDLMAFSVSPDLKDREFTVSSLSDAIRRNPNDTDLTIIQCKTNWNDNAQIPMLWDMIYNASSIRLKTISVGENGVNPQSFRNFSYAFATVPSNSRTKYQASTTAVLRVRGMSGGNYWGRPSVPDVCESLSEFFIKNFGRSFTTSVQSHVQNQLQKDPGLTRRFLELDF